MRQINHELVEVIVGARTHYKVRSAPNMSDDDGVSYIAVKGPNVNTYAVMTRIAKLLEATLNAAMDFAEAKEP